MNQDLRPKLVNLILAVVLLGFAIAAVIGLLQKSYVSAILCLLMAGFLLIAYRWSYYGRLSLIFFLLFFYLVAYATNVYFILTNKKGSNVLEEERIQAARKLGRSYDARTPLQVVADLKNRGIEAVPSAYPFELLATNGLPAQGQRLLPLAGLSRRTTVYCNECGNYTIYQADEHGFNNPLWLWAPQSVDLVLVGDSFCQGACVPCGADVASRLREAGPQVLNLGYGGNGPLLELATLREYVAPLKPKTVLWLYFEGNDLTDLEREKASPILARYLQNAAYTQALADRQGEIDQALSKYLDKVEVHLKRKGKPWYHHPRLLESLRSFQLKNLKAALRLMHANLHEYVYQENVHLFEQVLQQARDTVRSWGGTLYFVYLPSFYRYDGKSHIYPLNTRDLVISEVHRLAIPLIDFTPVINDLPDPLALFPFRKNGHYNAEGYRLLAREIAASLNGSASFENKISASSIK